MSINLSAQPGRGRICRITLNTSNRPVVMPAQLIPSLREYDEFADPQAVVKAVRKVDVVLPHYGRDYATGAIITVQSGPVARAFAVALLRAADMLEQEVPAAALDTLDADANAVTVASLMQDEEVIAAATA